MSAVYTYPGRSLADALGPLASSSGNLAKTGECNASSAPTDRKTQRMREPSGK